MVRKIILSVIVILCLCAVSMAQTIDDLVFIHHSCGNIWLNHSLHDALLAKDYIDERNDIYYDTDVAPDTGRPDSLTFYGGDTPGNNTNMNHWILWFNDYLSGVRSHECADGFNRIIMFKSCYPISNITGDGTEPGDPFSSTQTITNYQAVYRHPDGPGSTYTHNSYTYKPLEDIFAENPDILFIPVTAPPLCYTCTTDENAHRARLFNNWLKTDWLASYNAAHPGLHNVAVFDWFDVLAYPDNHLSHPNRLKAEYGGESSDSHPNSTANTYSTEVFATNPDNFIDNAWDAFAFYIPHLPTDFDADGVPDILWRWSIGFNSIWYMQSDGTSIKGTGRVPYRGTSWQACGVADFDVDGVPDILWRNPSTGANALWYMQSNGTSIKATAGMPSYGTSWQARGVADFDADGVPDILWRNPSTGANVLWYLDSDGTSIKATAGMPGCSTIWQACGVADFDADGVPDILWRNPSTGANALWYMQADGTSIKAVAGMPSCSTIWQVGKIADFDADGVPDILWRNTSGNNALWYLDSDGTAIKAVAGMPSCSTSWDIGG